MPVPLPHYRPSSPSRDPSGFLEGLEGYRWTRNGRDGLTVPFALLGQFKRGRPQSNSIIIVAGMAEIIAGTISMGLGGYLAGQTEMDHYEGEKRREAKEVREIPQEEEKEIKEILAAYGISPGVQTQVAGELAKDHTKWVDFMMRFELGLEKPDPHQAFLSAFRIGFSYAVGGLIPLSAYFFCKEPMQGLQYSSAVTVLCLLVFGYFKAHMTGQNPWKGALTVTAIGIAAAGAAFGIARLING